MVKTRPRRNAANGGDGVIRLILIAEAFDIVCLKLSCIPSGNLTIKALRLGICIFSNVWAPFGGP